MATTVANGTASAHRVIPEMRATSVKADLRKAEAADLRPVVGACIERARESRGWTLDELCGHLPAPESSGSRDCRQVARWIAGTERAQFDVLFGCDDDEFTELLFVQLAPLSRRYQPVIGLRRTA